MIFGIFLRHPEPRDQRAATIGLCLMLALNLAQGQAAEPTNPAALRDQVAVVGWLALRVELRAPEQAAAADNLEQTAQDLLFALPAGSYDGVQRAAGSASLTLRVDAAGLDALLLSPLAATVAAAGNPEMQRLAAGHAHSLAVKTDGSLWAWGGNWGAQLGDGTTTDRLTPIQVLTGVTAVSAGNVHTLAVRTDASLWAWGYSVYGQLGDGTTGTRSVPVQILTNVAAVSATNLHTLAIKTDGGLWAWGFNNYGQLGDGTTTNRSTPVQVLSGVAAMSAGLLHSLAIQTDGSLWAWGWNEYAQLGDGATTNRSTPVQVLTGVAAVSAGAYHTLALKTDGSLWAWGANWYGQLGDGTTTDRLTPAQVLTGVAAVSAGSNHTLALKTDGSLWAWGSNTGGALGDGTTERRLAPVEVLTRVTAMSAGNSHSLARKTDGSLWAWGGNSRSQLGDGTTMNRPSPVPVTGFAAAPAPDFVVTGVTLNPLDPSANGTFSATVTVRNQGTVSGAPGTVQIWANQTSPQGCSAVGNRSASMTGLGAGAVRNVTVSGLPAGSAGAKTLRVFVDSQCQTAEPDETNNQFIKAYTVRQSRPDFVVTRIVLTPASPRVGATFSAAVTVKNQGSMSGNGGYLDVWADQPTAPTCRADGDTFASVGTLAAGASTTLTVDGLLGGTPGAKTLRAFVDSYCDTQETSENNNQKTAVYTVAP